MAITSTPTVVNYKPAPTQVNDLNTVQVKKVTFAVPTSTSSDGYYTGDTISLKNVVPAGCAVTGILYKVSVTQGATLTFAANIDGQTAVVAATALTATVPTALTVVPAYSFSSGAGDVNLVLAGTTVGTTAATITFYLTLAAFEPPTGLTTYSL